MSTGCRSCDALGLCTRCSSGVLSISGCAPVRDVAAEGMSACKCVCLGGKAIADDQLGLSPDHPALMRNDALAVYRHALQCCAFIDHCMRCSL